MMAHTPTYNTPMMMSVRSGDVMNRYATPMMMHMMRMNRARNSTLIALSLSGYPHTPVGSLAVRDYEDIYLGAPTIFF